MCRAGEVRAESPPSSWTLCFLQDCSWAWLLFLSSASLVYFLFALVQWPFSPPPTPYPFPLSYCICSFPTYSCLSVLSRLYLVLYMYPPFSVLFWVWRNLCCSLCSATLSQFLISSSVWISLSAICSLSIFESLCPLYLSATLSRLPKQEAGNSGHPST